jgi:hypothetical protein
MCSSSFSEFNLYLAEQVNLLEIPCCRCDMAGHFVPAELDQVLTCVCCETCTAVSIQDFVPVEAEGCPVIDLDHLFPVRGEWCVPGDFDNGIFA